MCNDENELYQTKIYRNNCNGSCSCCGCGSNVGPAGPMGLQGPPGPQATRIIGNYVLSKKCGDQSAVFSAMYSCSFLSSSGNLKRISILPPS